MNQRTASVFIIGDELLAGDIADRNGPFLAEWLTEQGLRVRRIGILPDDTEILSESIRQALRTEDLLVLCGGLGPTSDDRTTEAVARALGRALVMDRGQWERIRQIFSVLKVGEPPPGNEKQAMFPEGSDVLPNELGTAPGYVVEKNGAVVAVLPGPPRENRPMVEKALLPWLNRNLAGRAPLAVKVLRVFGLGESDVGNRLRPLESANPDLSFGYRFSFPEILVKLRGEEADPDRLERVAGEVERILDPHVYGTGNDTLAAVLGRELAARGLRVVTAESCTGGLAAKLLTDIPGSSSWMERGFVTYTNTSKEELLRVPRNMLETSGAVSEQVARAMLAGALERSEADVGLAITGIAGPDGGTLEKPVGTVCIAWGDAAEQHTVTHGFHWDREYNRMISAWAAMRHLLLHITAE